MSFQTFQLKATVNESGFKNLVTQLRQCIDTAAWRSRRYKIQQSRKSLISFTLYNCRWLRACMQVQVCKICRQLEGAVVEPHIRLAFMPEARRGPSRHNFRENEEPGTQKGHLSIRRICSSGHATRRHKQHTTSPTSIRLSR